MKSNTPPLEHPWRNKKQKPLILDKREKLALFHYLRNRADLSPILVHLLNRLGRVPSCTAKCKYEGRDRNCQACK